MSQFIYRLPQPSVRYFRHYTTNRAANYSGWWSSILEQPLHKNDISDDVSELVPVNEETVELPVKHEQRERTVIPFGQESTTPVTPQAEPFVKKAQSFVELEGKRIPIPERPPTPDDCCMSGCAHCVWDIYQEDIEEYRVKKKDLRERLMAANVIVPPELLPKFTKGGDATDDVDPGMKAFLEMEKRLQGR